MNFRSDALCKLNLPPLMGRRDAAFDSVGVIGSPGMLKCSDSERLEIYRQAMEQLHRCGYEQYRLPATRAQFRRVP